jgi:hypothetical protein
VHVTRTRFSSRGPAAKRGTVLRFRLRKPGTVEIVIRGADCSVLGRKRIRGHRGLNRVRFNGRVRGRPLASGRYSIALVVTRGSSRKHLGTIGVEVVPPGSRLTKAQRSAPVGSTCVAPASATLLPVPIVSTAPPAVGAGSAEPGRSSPEPERSVKHKSKTGVLGVSLKPPRLVVPMGGAPTWLGVLLIVLFGLSLTALAVYVAGHLRGNWHL